MLAIKLQRIGKKHQPSYRVVVAERRSKLAGPPVDDLGSYDQRTKQLNVAKDRVEHWLKIGAAPTITVWNLFVSHKLASGSKVAVKMAKPKTVAEAGQAAPAKAEAPAA